MAAPLTAPAAAGPRIAVVGAGFTGTLCAVQLLRRLPGPATVTLIDRRGSFGPGLAYSTGNPQHLLNVRAANMSAFPEHPTHFVDWLATHRTRRGEAVEEGAGAIFVSRGLYGRYLEELLADARTAAPAGVTLDTCHADVVSLESDDQGHRLILTDGQTLEADQVVLSLGNFPPTLQGRETPELWESSRYVGDPWDARALGRIGPDDPVLIIGTGLTMVDVMISLEEQGHHGSIVAVSRRGLLPTTHTDTSPYPPYLDPEHLPTTVAEVARRIRQEVHTAAAQGIPWQSVIDALRPVTAAMWQGFSLTERQRFLRVVRPYWDIHRHRLAPAIAASLRTARESGRLTVAAGRIVRIAVDEAEVELDLRRRHSGIPVTFSGAYLVNCSGPESDYQHIRHPLVRHLLATGVVRRDPLNLGLEVASDCALIGREGLPAPGLYALGPMTRGAFWEITAVPDIRQQCAQFAEQLVGHLSEPRASATGFSAYR